MSNAVKFFEISGPNADALRAFYGDVLGLPLDAPDEYGYAMFSPSDGAIGGAVWDAAGAWTESDTTYAVAYIEVDDVERCVAAAEAAGAKVVIAPRQHGPTVIAHLLDPAGNRVGVFRMAQPDASTLAAPAGEWPVRAPGSS